MEPPIEDRAGVNCLHGIEIYGSLASAFYTDLSYGRLPIAELTEFWILV